MAWHCNHSMIYLYLFYFLLFYECMIVGYFILFILLLHTLDSMGCCNRLISHAWDEIKFLSYLIELHFRRRRYIFPLRHTEVKRGASRLTRARQVAAGWGARLTLDWHSLYPLRACHKYTHLLTSTSTCCLPLPLEPPTPGCDWTLDSEWQHHNITV